jgi:nitrogen regulatory protein P-II 1
MLNTTGRVGVCTRRSPNMKLIEAYIPPEALEEVRELLLSQGLDDMVASEAAVEASDEYRTLWESLTVDFVPQLKLEVAVSDDRASATAHQILDAVRERGTGCTAQVVIGRLDQVVRIETGERGPAAL